MIKRLSISVTLFAIIAVAHSAIDGHVSNDDVIARVGRVQSTHFPSRHNSLGSSGSSAQVNSAESVSSTRTSGSVNQIQPTSATKVTSFTNGASTSPSESSRTGSSGSSASSGATVYNIQEQIQPPNANAPQYVYSQSSVAAGGTQMMVPEAGPVLMQILTPQGQPTGQIQYIQFLRPVMMQMVPQSYVAPTITPNTQPQTPTISAAAAISQQYTPSTPVASQFTPITRSYATAASSSEPLISNTIPSSYRSSAPLGPTSASDGGFYPYVQTPLSSYSSPPETYYGPPVYSSKRIRLVNGPSRLDLNTNEYLPAASQRAYSIMQPMRA